jgi:hypothetical protein
MHLTGNGRERLLANSALDKILDENKGLLGIGSTWVYISEPNAKVACKRRRNKGVEWYKTNWDI